MTNLVALLDLAFPFAWPPRAMLALTGRLNDAALRTARRARQTHAGA